MLAINHCSSFQGQKKNAAGPETITVAALVLQGVAEH